MSESSRRSFPSPRLAACCGVAGPIMFTLAWIVLGAAWPGYDPRAHYISELAASDAPHAWAMVAAFLLLGVLVLVFARGLWGVLGTIVPALVGVFGAGSIGSGIARCDPGCGGASFANQAHTTITYCGLGALTLATLALPWVVGRDPSPAAAGTRRGYRVYSALTGVLAAIIFVRGFEAFGGVGLGQRLFVSLLFVWLVVLAMRLGRGDRTPRPATAGAPAVGTPLLAGEGESAR